jgi:hypothetical protein
MISVTKDQIVELLCDETKSFNYLNQTKVERSFVNKRFLTEDATKILRKVLINGNIKQDLTDKGIFDCRRYGWLHSEPLGKTAGEDNEMVCVFPTRLHAK